MTLLGYDKDIVNSSSYFFDVQGLFGGHERFFLGPVVGKRSPSLDRDADLLTNVTSVQDIITYRLLLDGQKLFGPARHLKDSS